MLPPCHMMSPSSEELPTSVQQTHYQARYNTTGNQAQVSAELSGTLLYLCLTKGVKSIRKHIHLSAVSLIPSS